MFIVFLIDHILKLYTALHLKDIFKSSSNIISVLNVPHFIIARSAIESFVIITICVLSVPNYLTPCIKRFRTGVSKNKMMAANPVNITNTIKN